MDIKVDQLKQLTQMEAPKRDVSKGEDFKFTLIKNIEEDKLQEKLSSLSKAHGHKGYEKISLLSKGIYE